MKIILNGEEDITKICSDIEWVGNEGQVARKLNFNIISSPVDDNLPNIDIELGDLLQLFEDDEELFRGYIFKRNKEYQSIKMKITALDGSIYLLENRGAYNFKGITPEAICKNILREFDLPIGNIVPTKREIDLVVMGKSLYEIIMEAYKKVGKETGKEYELVMNKGKIDVIEVGEVIMQGELKSTELLNSIYEDTLEDMVNKISIVDKEGNEVAEVTNDEWIHDYGQFQDILQEGESDNTNDVAENMLQGLSRKASIETMNNTKLRSGYGVKIEDGYTGVVGKFKIIDDSHKWRNNHHYVDLKLEFIDTEEG